jgi:hypothetical protein
VEKLAKYDVAVYQLKGVSDKAGHAEQAAAQYRRTLGKTGPAATRIAEVQSAITTNQVCGPECGRALTEYVGRPGVKIEEGGRGYSGGRVLDLDTVKSMRSQLGMKGRSFSVVATWLRVLRVADREEGH